ncbi:hypothetical protein EZS27_027178 [termite gut metagenome]|uniref:Uncharacterized protein n=1 Tax=termite gut metagenome TaxID=433724 RepID=A0A5J4QNA5_9ZZZZ
MLVEVIENALYSYDEKGAFYIQDFVGQNIDITNPLSFIISQALQIKFVKMPSGKKRFRKIPELLITHFSDIQTEYQELVKHLEISAKANNCEIEELDFDEYPEIKW